MTTKRTPADLARLALTRTRLAHLALEELIQDQDKPSRQLVTTLSVLEVAEETLRSWLARHPDPK